MSGQRHGPSVEVRYSCHGCRWLGPQARESGQTDADVGAACYEPSLVLEMRIPQAISVDKNPPAPRWCPYRKDSRP